MKMFSHPPKVSFCTVAMNRLHHIKETLPKNLASAKKDNLEVVLLDYHSSDGLGEWVKSNMGKYLESGKLKYYRTEDSTIFLRSHSRNMVFRLAEGDILCNMDADNYSNGDFASYISNHFKKEKSGILWTEQKKVSTDLYGRLCVKKQDFLSVRGFDERMNYYSYEDFDFCHRLKRKGLELNYIDDKDYLKFIGHDYDDRLGNDGFYGKLENVFVKYNGLNETELLLLLQGNKALYGTIGKNKTPVRTMGVLKEGEWVTGDKKELEEGYIVRFSNEKKFSKGINQQYLIDQNSGDKFKNMTGSSLHNKLQSQVGYIQNASVFAENIAKERVVVNNDGFGKGVVYKNFDTNHAIKLN